MIFRILFDSNIIIDALTNREGSNKYSRKLLEAATLGEVRGFIAAKQITDIYYCLRHCIDNDSLRGEILDFLLSTFDIIETDSDVLRNALKEEFDDYEDAVIARSAQSGDVDMIATANTKHFRNSFVPALRPEDIHYDDENWKRPHSPFKGLKRIG